MKIIWLGHSGFRIDIGDQVLPVDPWFNGNPMFPVDRRDDAVADVTHILVSHGHGDHAGDAAALSKELNAPLVGIYDLMSWWGEKESIKTVGFNKGGTVALGDVKVTMVNAVHSSSGGGDGGPVYAANTFFNFETVIPCHYRTFPLLELSADTLKAMVPDVNVVEPEVLQAMEL